MAAPLGEVYFYSLRATYLAVPILALALVFSRGCYALVFPELKHKLRYAVRLGAVSAIAFLLVSPLAFKFALLNFAVRPSWIVLTVVGMVEIGGYMWLALKRDRRGAVVA